MPQIRHRWKKKFPPPSGLLTNGENGVEIRFFVTVSCVP